MTVPFNGTLTDGRKVENEVYQIVLTLGKAFGVFEKEKDGVG